MKPHVANRPESFTPQDSSSIRTQLEAVLGSPQFRNSKRSYSLLKFVVEAAIEGRADHLKERLVGTEVFGREPLYETAQDPIVRNAAIEVRKRLAQYYTDPERSWQVRIELPSGSYVPEFSWPALAPVEVPVVPPRRRRRSLLLVPLAAAVGGLPAWTWFGRQTAFDAFWRPVFETESIVQVCIGEPRGLFRVQGPRQAELVSELKQADKPVTLAAAEVEEVETRFLYRRDAIVMAQFAAMLKSRDVPYRLRADSDAPYGELRGNPLILVGGFDATRQMNLRPSQRFSFGRETIDGIEYKYVTDRQNPGHRGWRFRYSTSSVLEPTDYAIITKTLVYATGQPVISVLGATDYSTLAAGEFITSPEKLNELGKSGPAGWERKNVQIVVQTRVIQGIPGPTHAVAIHAW